MGRVDGPGTSDGAPADGRLKPSFLVGRDGTSSCIQCVLDAGETRSYHTLAGSIIHLDDHRRMGHAIDPEVVEFLKRLKQEQQNQANRRAAPTDDD